MYLISHPERSVRGVWTIWSPRPGFPVHFYHLPSQSCIIFTSLCQSHQMRQFQLSSPQIWRNSLRNCVLIKTYSWREKFAFIMQFRRRANGDVKSSPAAGRPRVMKAPVRVNVQRESGLASDIEQERPGVRPRRPDAGGKLSGCRRYTANIGGEYFRKM